MPPEALHHAAKALANWTNSTSSPGSIELAASLNTAMLMVLAPTPRTEEAPPGPGSQILPTPGHWPFVESASVRPADVAAVADVDESATHVPPSSVAATTIGSAVRRSSRTPLRSTRGTPSPLGSFAFGSFPQRPV